MRRYCPWIKSTKADDVEHSEQLETFSHFTYMHSQQNLVACDFQGVVKDNNTEGKKTLYIVTDSIIHSR